MLMKRRFLVFYCTSASLQASPPHFSGKGKKLKKNARILFLTQFVVIANLLPEAAN